MNSSSKRASLYRRHGKRVLDLAVAIPLTIAALPLVLFGAVLVGLSLGTPILFRQHRPGLRGRPFVPLKFRTMNDLSDHMGHPKPDAARLTRVGRFLRASSLDELPELLNVVKGEMSLVGPRPLLMNYLDRYTPEQARRHDIRPGITGWAQVNGRNALTWEEKFSFDIWYVDHLSLGVDLKILGKTVRQVLLGQGIHAPGHVSMPEFRGEGE